MHNFFYSAGGIIISIIIGIFASCILWYNVQLSPVGGDISKLTKVVIVSGSSPVQIAETLKDKSLIRNLSAFNIYTRLTGKRNNLKAGTYHLSSAQSTRQIVDHLVKGSVDTFNITFYPGATLTENKNESNSKKDDVTSMMAKAGYSLPEISVALSDKYSSPLFANKPATADLEGYVYGETYNFNTGVSAHDILQRTFDEFYSVVQKDNLITSFKSHGLNLYEGITLASIIQREVSKPDDQKNVAQVFYNRMKIGMGLGSDVTYQYIADKTGVARDPKLISPYNTRNVIGLPPGPISAPGRSALQAVANPTDNDYLFFLSGDDNITYFARTNAEHLANKTAHCQKKCSIQ